MKKFNLAFAAIGIIAFVFVGSFTNTSKLMAQDREVVTVQSKKSFDETVDQLHQLVAKNGMMVLAEVNHGKILSMTLNFPSPGTVSSGYPGIISITSKRVIEDTSTSCLDPTHHA